VSTQKKLATRRERRTNRVRNALKNNGSQKPRISVFRSLKHIYAQIIDDATQSTLVSCSSLQIDVKGDKKEVARKVGLELGKKARGLSISEVYFDRGSYLYHGRVKELAEGLREGGLVF
jgi:large subunit ribosomal protein L18